jgi:hypothetical protein
MNLFLLHWAIFIFMVGLVLSLPLGAVFYLKNSELTQFFTNARKLKAAHLDYIMQAFSIGIVYVLELATNTRLPLFAVVPLAFGTFCNPFIFLLEATSLCKRGFSKILYKILKATSPSALFFAWFVLLFEFLPAIYGLLLFAFVVVFVIAFFSNKTMLLKNKNDITSM